MRRPKVLILTISHGAAHQRVASALAKALLELAPDLTLEVVNALKHYARWFRLYYDSYKIPLKYCPGLWGWIENLQHNHSSTGPGWLYRAGARPLFRLIQAFGPDVVIATEVGVCELAAMLKRESKAPFFLVGATAGVDVDRAWAQPEVDLYPIFPGEVAGQAEAAGVPPDKILPCGLPIDPGFACVPDRATVRKRLQLEPEVPLLLVLFGGAGLGKPRQILGELHNLTQPLQVSFVTGRNQRLEEEIRQSSKGRPDFRVSGWVDNMHEWMGAADLLVSKPGGTTVIEAINSGLPILAFDPLPGAERRACDLIEKWEVGYWIRRSEDLAPAVTRLLANRDELQRLRQHALGLAKPHAAREAAEAILKLWKSRS